MMIIKNKEDNNSIDLLTKYLTPKFFVKKNVLSSFLKYIYLDYFKRSHSIFNSYTFQEITDLPMFCSDKIFYFMSSNYKQSTNNVEIMSQNQFISGTIFLIYENLLKRMYTSFKIYDFDNDEIIYKDDVFLLLAHFHLIMNTNENIDLLEKIINNFFKEDESLTKIQYYQKIQNKNCDIALLLYVFINKFFPFFKQKEVKYFSKLSKDDDFCLNVNSSKEDETKEDTNNAISGYENFTFNTKNMFQDLYEIPTDYSQLKNALTNKFKVTHYLYKYISNTNFPNEQNEELDETISSKDSENDDFKDLIDFENDITKVFNQMSKLSKLLNCDIKKRNFSKNKTLGTKYLRGKYNIEEENYDDSDFQSEKDIDKNNILKANVKVPITSSFYDDTKQHQNKNFLHLNTTENEKPKGINIRLKNKLSKAITFFGSENLKKNEILLYKHINSIKSESDIIKLSIINKYIFCFKKVNNDCIFKKIIYCNCIYPKIQKSNSIIQLILTSTVHNYTKQIVYISKNKNAVEMFYNLLCEKINYKKIKNDIELQKDVGKGKFGCVLLGLDKTIHSSISQYYAVKIVNKNNPTVEEYKINRWEITIFNTLKNIHHPNIIKCYKKYENEKNIFFVYEFIKGSDLKVFTKTNHSLEFIDDNLLISFQIIKGITELHKYGIIHRDIKTTNILINSKGPKHKDSVKIIDFGLGRVLGFHELSNDPYGSLCFKAPELISHLPYSFKVDVWAVGVTIYYLMFKCLPFEKGNKQQIKNSIQNSSLKFPVEEDSFLNYFFKLFDKSDIDIFNDYSECSNYLSIIYSIIKQCLDKNVDKRPSSIDLYNSFIKK